MNFSIKTPAGFDFKRTLQSHGWYDLPPFEMLGDATIVRVLDAGEAAPVSVTITGDRRALRVSTPRRLGKSAAARVERDVRHISGLGEPLTEFYAAVTGDPDFAWIARDGAGRLLRSLTVYEDLVKTIMTTNCSWTLRRNRVTEIDGKLGRQAAEGR